MNPYNIRKFFIKFIKSNEFLNDPRKLSKLIGKINFQRYYDNYKVNSFKGCINEIFSNIQIFQHIQFMLGFLKTFKIIIVISQHKLRIQNIILRWFPLDPIQINLLILSMIIISCTMVLFKIYWLKWLGDIGVFK